jgi:hypothetical protein
MGNAFDEDDRSAKFDNIISDLFHGIARRKEFFSSSTSEARIDRTYYLENVIVTVRVDKNEFESGDAFLQSARSYDIICTAMNQTNPMALLSGLPVFLLALNGLFLITIRVCMALTRTLGPLLTISGGFWDHGTSIVEPLCASLLMLADMDHINGRAMRLAQYLYAIRQCLHKLLPNR